MTSRLPHFAVLALCAAAAASGAFAPAYAQAPAIAVPVVAAVPRAVPTGFELDGVVEPVTQATVSTQASGRVASLAVKAGDRVRAGQLLATIDDREARAVVQRSQAQLVRAEADLRNAQLQFDRTRELEAKGFVSRAALDTAGANFKAASASRDEAAAGRQQSAIAQGFTQVTAPYDGWVRETLMQAGDLAVPGKPLLTLYAPQPLRVVVQVPASRAESVRGANAVEVRLGEGAKTRWIAPSSRAMLPAADPVSQTIETRLELPAAESARLAPGQQVRARFAGASESRLAVPPQSVLRRGELTAVYAASPDGSHFVLKAVRLGADHGSEGIEVLAGLAKGEQVALDPVKAGLAGARPQAK